MTDNTEGLALPYIVDSVVWDSIVFREVPHGDIIALKTSEIAYVRKDAESGHVEIVTLNGSKVLAGHSLEEILFARRVTT